MNLNLNGADCLQVGDKGYNGDTEGAYVVAYTSSVGIDLRHEVNGSQINKMSHRESCEQDWRWFRDSQATTTGVAQAISGAVDEAQEGIVGLEGGLFLSEKSDLRVTEVSAELKTTGDVSEFTVSTSDGKRFVVSVREA